MQTTATSAAAEMSEAEQTLGLVHGAAYVAMGLWPTLNLRSFARATGPKPEGWLVKAVGLLLVSIGVTLIRGTRNREGKSVPTLAVGAASALGSVALFYSAKRRISPVYFADAAFHLGLASTWGVLLARKAMGKRRVRVA